VWSPRRRWPTCSWCAVQLLLAQLLAVDLGAIVFWLALGALFSVGVVAAARPVRTLAALAGPDGLSAVRQDGGVTNTSTGTLVLLRHGESEWNKSNLFTGWVDVPLSEKGRVEAARSGQLLAENGLLPDVLHTSVLKRAIATAELALGEADRQWIPVRRSWRLNERHYGALQGKDKAATLAEYGEEQFLLWRRSYDTPPPPIEAGSEFSQEGDDRYAFLPPEARPKAECLKDVVVRMLPYWYDAIVPDLRSGQTVLVAAHGNSLRALVKHLDGMGDAEVVGLNIPTGVPLRYDLDDDLRPLKPGGEYLDPEAAAAAIEAVKNQGKK
jgi:2,3-bisphosphoglycerate-dependent phosphoglycerate mutase